MKLLILAICAFLPAQETGTVKKGASLKELLARFKKEYRSARGSDGKMQALNDVTSILFATGKGKQDKGFIKEFGNILIKERDLQMTEALISVLGNYLNNPDAASQIVTFITKISAEKRRLFQSPRKDELDQWKQYRELLIKSVYTLAAIHSQDVVETLLKISDHYDCKVATSAIDALAQFRLKKVVDKLIALDKQWFAEKYDIDKKISQLVLMENAPPPDTGSSGGSDSVAAGDSKINDKAKDNSAVSKGGGSDGAGEKGGGAGAKEDTFSKIDKMKKIAMQKEKEKAQSLPPDTGRGGNEDDSVPGKEGKAKKDAPELKDKSSSGAEEKPDAQKTPIEQAQSELERAVVRISAINKSLTALTGQTFGDSKDWTNWWARNKKEYVEEKR